MTDRPAHCIPATLGASLKGLLFDVDGTLYDQRLLRRAMLLLLVRSHVLVPVAGLRTARVLAAYRRAQETLRVSGEIHTDLADAQVRLAARFSRASEEVVRDRVARWMERAPLPHLSATLRPGIAELVRTCRDRGMRLGVVSDYPAGEKLDAMGLRELFDVAVSAQEPEVGVFKPHPRGIEVALERLNLCPAEVAYVGDRPDADADAARRAGVAALILTTRTGYRSADGSYAFREFHELRNALFPSESDRP